MRWTSELKLTSEFNWIGIAHNKRKWDEMRTAYVQKWKNIENVEIKHIHS